MTVLGVTILSARFIIEMLFFISTILLLGCTPVRQESEIVDTLKNSLDSIGSKAMNDFSDWSSKNSQVAIGHAAFRGILVVTAEDRRPAHFERIE
jgi:hypothetical protein